MEPQYTNEHSLNPETLQTLEACLRKGLTFRAFLSGGGLRVVRIEGAGGRVLMGYGEHYCIEVALDHAAENFIDHKPYSKQYGEGGHTPYLTGSSLPNSRLDLWILQSHKFKAYEKEDGAIVFELHGYEDTVHPEGVDERARAGEHVRWSNRGYVYETTISNFRGGGLSTCVISSPEGRDSGSDPWMYQVVKTGVAPTLAEAIERAFEAPGVETPEDD